jgi:hypothetical protein
MGHPTLIPEAAPHLMQALYWAGWILSGLSSIVALTSLVFVWHECYRPAGREPHVLWSRTSIARHSPPQTSRPRFVMVRLTQIVLTAPGRAAPVTAQGNAGRE